MPTRPPTSSTVPSAVPPLSEGPSADDDAVYVFSSGTTDRPKAVRHTHRSISLAVVHWQLALGLGHDDRFQVATPPSHILGLLNLLTAAAAGATVRLHRRFDLDAELRAIQEDRMTLEMAVAPIALAMANHPDLESYDLSSLRYIMWGATPVTPAVAETVTARSGVRWLPAYGTSEVPVIAANPVTEPGQWRLESAGLPVGDVELRVVDLESGDVLAAGETGEVEVRSATAMAGYLPDDATAAAFDDGWYRTGDVGWLEGDGWVHLTDRCKEMIKVSGFQVAPAEIEAVLHAHPAVVDCAVFGVADERAGEVPVAAVQLAPGADVSPDDLQRLVAESLAGYKRLHRVVVVDAVPRHAVGQGVTPHAAGRVGAPARIDGYDRQGLSGRPPLARAGGPARRGGAGGRPPRADDGGAARRRRARPPSWTPPSTRPAGASCARRPTTAARGPPRSRSP